MSKTQYSSATSVACRRSGAHRKTLRKPLYCVSFNGQIGWTIDLSSWGARIRPPVPLQPGAEIEVCLELYPGHLGIQACALVRWYHPKKQQAGLEFLGMSARSKRELDGLLAGER